MDSFLALLQSAVLTVVTALISFGALVTSFFPVVPPPQAYVAPSATTTETFPVAQEPQTTDETPLPSQATTSQPSPATPVSVPTAPVPAPKPTKTEAEVNTEARAALVNILCTTLAGGSFKPISGSGIFIDSRGVILTNAHIGQYFLLRDYGVKDNVDCTIRIGSPAQNRYRAKLLYLPPKWIDANASQITAQQGTGTGEYDFALLVVTGTTDPAGTLPQSFPYIGMDATQPDIGQQMLLAGYPAGFLSGELITTSLFASSALAFVTQLFTFDATPNVDLFSIGGTVVSQGGSSGGAAVRLSNGKLAGIIATATTGASTGQRDLRAVSVFHIDRALAQEGKEGMVGLLSGDVQAKATEFNNTVAPALTKKLTDVLNGN